MLFVFISTLVFGFIWIIFHLIYGLSRKKVFLEIFLIFLFPSFFSSYEYFSYILMQRLRDIKQNIKKTDFVSLLFWTYYQNVSKDNSTEKRFNVSQNEYLFRHWKYNNKKCMFIFNSSYHCWCLSFLMFFCLEFLLRLESFYS